MIDLKERKRDWSATSAKGGQFESAEGGQFGRRVYYNKRNTQIFEHISKGPTDNIVNIR